MVLYEKLKPAASKHWLITAAGAMWSCVGLMLCHMAYEWLSPVNIKQAILLALIGVLSALIIFRFGFSIFAKRNIQRIWELVGDKFCIFAFQEWISYPLVVVMVALGITLRKYSPILKPYLAVLYLGIGGGLFLSSLHYYWDLRRHKNVPKTEIRVQG